MTISGRSERPVRVASYVHHGPEEQSARSRIPQSHDEMPAILIDQSADVNYLRFPLPSHAQSTPTEVRAGDHLPAPHVRHWDRYTAGPRGGIAPSPPDSSALRSPPARRSQRPQGTAFDTARTRPMHDHRDEEPRQLAWRR
jgi:hypothetical protein